MENKVDKLNEFKKQSTTFLYDFCNIENLFTCGSTEQYQKMFDITKHSTEESYENYFALLAHIIWLCSDRYALSVIDNIYKMLLDMYSGFCAHYEII